jgi:hypothetical protein
MGILPLLSAYNRNMSLTRSAATSAAVIPTLLSSAPRMLVACTAEDDGIPSI